MEHIKASIHTIGKVDHKPDQATALVEGIDSNLTALKGIVKNRKILMVIGHNTSLDKQIFVAGKNLYFDDIIKTSGNQNALVSQRKGQPVLNIENIIATNPDMVILLAPFREDKGLSKQALLEPWKSLPINASKNGAIYLIDKDYAGVPSDRLVLFLNDFREILNEFKHQ